MIAQPLIFLDIDGVLNSETFFKGIEDNHFKRCTKDDPEDPLRCTCFNQEKMIDRTMVARLNRILGATNAQVVLSSSWRNLLHFKEVERILQQHGFAGAIRDATPDLPNDPDYVKLRADNAIDRITRGHEIAYWLESCLGVDPRFSTTVAADALLRRLLAPSAPKFVILDDCDDMLHLKPWHILTDSWEGLLDEHVDDAIARLGGQ